VKKSAWCDLYVPPDATPGTYTGTLTLDCDQISPTSIGLKVIVYDLMVPDVPTFFVALKGYGNKWSSEASRYQVFQFCHKHRMVPNTLPYGWNGSTTTDRRPKLTGSGPTTVSSLNTFGSNYGPFFDGSGLSPDHPTYPYRGPAGIT